MAYDVSILREKDKDITVECTLLHVAGVISIISTKCMEKREVKGDDFQILEFIIAAE